MYHLIPNLRISSLQNSTETVRIVVLYPVQYCLCQSIYNWANVISWKTHLACWYRENFIASFYVSSVIYVTSGRDVHCATPSPLLRKQCCRSKEGWK